MKEFTHAGSCRCDLVARCACISRAEWLSVDQSALAAVLGTDYKRIKTYALSCCSLCTRITEQLTKKQLKPKKNSDMSIC